MASGCHDSGEPCPLYNPPVDEAEIRRAKREIRREVRARVAAMTPDERTQAAETACRAAAGEAHFRDAGAVLLSLSLPDEIDASPLLIAALGAGKRVFLPRMDWDRASMGGVEVFSPDFPIEVRRHGVPEPVGASVIEPAALDVVLVPGVAFDRQGGRIGRGKGFYDRFLARAGRGTFRLALCFSAQIVDRVPRDDHDEPVDAIASESGLTVC